MDAKQAWVGSYFTLDTVSAFLHELDGSLTSNPKVHEIFVTWVVAKFLQSVNKSAHLIGFPSIQSHEGRKLVDFLFGDAALDNDNFDTVIIDSKSPLVPMRWSGPESVDTC